MRAGPVCSSRTPGDGLRHDEGSQACAVVVAPGCPRRADAVAISSIVTDRLCGSIQMITRVVTVPPARNQNRLSSREGSTSSS